LLFLGGKNHFKYLNKIFDSETPMVTTIGESDASPEENL
jgi:hypothetical protein